MSIIGPFLAIPLAGDLSHACGNMGDLQSVTRPTPNRHRAGFSLKSKTSRVSRRARQKAGTPGLPEPLGVAGWRQARMITNFQYQTCVCQAAAAPQRPSHPASPQSPQMHRGCARVPLYSTLLYHTAAPSLQTERVLLLLSCPLALAAP